MPRTRLPAGMPVNTLPPPCTSELLTSGAYSTERSSTSKYSGSSVAVTTPANCPSTSFHAFTRLSE